MKTRVLFLDDESLALQGLQRMLRNMRDAWEMTFVESGLQALELMERTPFDVVVSDMLMPVMTGAEFLNEVRRRHPHTIRLILSGHAERELILQCVGAAHQFLAKPCPPETLKAALGRIALLHAALQSNDLLKQCIPRMDRLPSVPTLYIDLAESLLTATVSLEEVTKIVIQDPGTTAATLKMVNSGFFGTAREIPGVTEAIACLGLDTFKTLAFHLNAFSPFDAALFREKSLDDLWHHSVDVAIMAKRIAESERADAKVVEAAYTAGLLHDLGKFVLILHFAERHREAAALAEGRAMSLSSAEREIFGFSHAEAGASLLELWGLPASIVEAVAWHHSPRQSTTNAFSPLAAVHAANAFAHERSDSARNWPASEIDPSYLAQIGLTERLSAWHQASK